MTYRKDWMTDDQYSCHETLAQIVRGFHHIGNKVKPCGNGIETSIYGGWASFDFDQLTRAVVIAHDNMVRIEIGSSGPGLFRLMLHKRKGRDGDINERHPTIEDAIEKVRTQR